MTSYYVYYRVAPDRMEAVQRAVRTLFDTVERETGVRGRWMRRRDEATTFMEVYEDVTEEPAFEAVLERESAALGLERKTERFICA